MQCSSYICKWCITRTKFILSFEGGTTFEFDEAPRAEAKVDIFFYKGQDGVDVDVLQIFNKQLRLVMN